MRGVGRWFLPGAGLGWIAALAFLAWVLPNNILFVDDPLAGAVVLLVLPAAIAGLLAMLVASVGRRALRGRRGVSEFTVIRLRRVSISAGLVTVFLCALSLLAPTPPLHTRLMVFGVDAASPDVIESLVQLDQLPGFTSLREEGAGGVLRSLEPMLSPIVWTTIASGQPLDRHGIHGFHTTSPDCRAARFWDVFEDRGMTVGLYKWLVTYPPHEGSGFMVPGWLATGPETVPHDLQFARAFEQRQKARSRDGGGLSPGHSAGFAFRGARKGLRLSTLVQGALYVAKGPLGGDPDLRYTEVQRLRARIDFDLFFALLNRFDPEVATFTYYPTDAVAHRTWKYYEPDKFGGVSEADATRWDAIPSTYRQADEFLVELRRRLPNDVVLVVLSDHGMCAAGDSGGAAAHGLRSGEIQRLIEAAGGTVDVTQQGMKVTVAVPADSVLPVDEVRGKLGQIRFDGKPLLRIETLAPTMLGLTLAAEGDLAARVAEEVVVPDGGAATLADFLRTHPGTSGVHHEEGVLYLVGPGIQPGALINGADLYDVAPTLLAAVGVPPAADMEGRVLDEAFLAAPEFGDHPASYLDAVPSEFVAVTGSDDGADALEQRLRALGYVDQPQGSP
jgi:Type I phosphodiesterase / nucleotide pyrophosphatase